jgi:hypothetical protein
MFHVEVPGHVGGDAQPPGNVVHQARIPGQDLPQNRFF